MDREGQNRRKRKKEGNKRAVVETEKSKRTQGLDQSKKGKLVRRDKYRVIHKSLRDFRTRLRNNQDRHGRKEHINR